MASRGGLTSVVCLALLLARLGEGGHDATQRRQDHHRKIAETSHEAQHAVGARKVKALIAVMVRALGC